LGTSQKEHDGPKKALEDPKQQKKIAIKPKQSRMDRYFGGRQKTPATHQPLSRSKEKSFQYRTDVHGREATKDHKTQGDRRTQGLTSVKRGMTMLKKKGQKKKKRRRTEGGGVER